MSNNGMLPASGMGAKHPEPSSEGEGGPLLPSLRSLAACRALVAASPVQCLSRPRFPLEKMGRRAEARRAGQEKDSQGS
jgi:hypothetical protein